MNMKQVFICYAREDFDQAMKLCKELKDCGLNPWIDKVNLLPGQIWETEIRNAIGESRFFVALLSSKSVKKKGYCQKEIVKALEILDEFPPGTIFLIPVRLDNCTPSHPKIKDLQWVDIFPTWDKGLGILKQAMGIVAGTSPMPTGGERDVLMQILKAGTNAYFSDIAHAPTEKKRQEAIEALHNTIRRQLMTTIQMPEMVYSFYIEECIHGQELLDWDQWLTKRLTNMAGLPQELQQSLFDFGFTRLRSMM